MSTLYRDRWIECTDDALHIHGYYFPLGHQAGALQRDPHGPPVIA